MENKLILDYVPVYLYEAVIQLKIMVSIRLTAIIFMAVKLQVWGLNSTVFYLYKLYYTVTVHSPICP